MEQALLTPTHPPLRTSVQTLSWLVVSHIVICVYSDRSRPGPHDLMLDSREVVSGFGTTAELLSINVGEGETEPALAQVSAVTIGRQRFQLVKLNDTAGRYEYSTHSTCEIVILGLC